MAIFGLKLLRKSQKIAKNSKLDSKFWVFWVFQVFWVKQNFEFFPNFLCVFFRKKFRHFSRVSVIAFFRDFHFLKKNDVQLVSSQLAKTCSDSKLDSKFRIKVRNAGPYFWPLWTIIFCCELFVSWKKAYILENESCLCTSVIKWHIHGEGVKNKPKKVWRVLFEDRLFNVERNE